MKLYLASGNIHKAQEMAALAATTGTQVEIISARTVGGMPQVEEDTGTFVGNARKKAAALKAKLLSSAWVLSDDSGLCVDALNGAPGVESAYYAGPAGDSAANLRKLINDVRDVPEGKRSACFVCVLVLLGPMGLERIFEGRCNGILLNEPRGQEGFGYDPIFVPEGYNVTFSELSEKEKNLVSHRGRAWSAASDWLKANLPKPKQPLRSA